MIAVQEIQEQAPQKNIYCIEQIRITSIKPRVTITPLKNRKRPKIDVDVKVDMEKKIKDVGPDWRKVPRESPFEPSLVQYPIRRRY